MNCVPSIRYANRVELRKTSGTQRGDVWNSIKVVIVSCSSSCLFSSASISCARKSGSLAPAAAKRLTELCYAQSLHQWRLLISLTLLAVNLTLPFVLHFEERYSRDER